jgi:hypothetical protein
MPSVCGRPRILRSIGAHQKRASSPRHGTHKRRRARRCSHASGRGSAHDAASGWAAMAEQGCAMVEAGPCGRGRLLSAVFWLWAPMMTKDARDVPPAAAPLVHTAEACVWAASRCCACAGRRPLGIGPSGAPLMGTTICTRCSCAAAPRRRRTCSGVRVHAARLHRSACRLVRARGGPSICVAVLRRRRRRPRSARGACWTLRSVPFAPSPRTSSASCHTAAVRRCPAAATAAVLSGPSDSSLSRPRQAGPSLGPPFGTRPAGTLPWSKGICKLKAFHPSLAVARASPLQPRRHCQRAIAALPICSPRRCGLLAASR